MNKFESTSNIIEVVMLPVAMPFFLNRPIVTALCTLGAPDTVFMDMYHSHVHRVDRIMEGDEIALEVRCLA
jgi:RNA dependent RNA polymerase